VINVPQGLVLSLKSTVDLGQLKVVLHFDENINHLRFFLLFVAGIACSFIGSVVLLLE
jgi:hypothetical protein